MDILDELERPYERKSNPGFIDKLPEKLRLKVLDLRQRYANGRIKGWPMKAIHEFAQSKLGLRISLTTFYRFMEETPKSEETDCGKKEQGPARRTRSAAPVRAGKKRA